MSYVTACVHSSQANVQLGRRQRVGEKTKTEDISTSPTQCIPNTKDSHQASLKLYRSPFSSAPFGSWSTLTMLTGQPPLSYPIPQPTVCSNGFTPHVPRPHLMSEVLSQSLTEDKLCRCGLAWSVRG